MTDQPYTFVRKAIYIYKLHSYYTYIHHICIQHVITALTANIYKYKYISHVIYTYHLLLATK